MTAGSRGFPYDRPENVQFNGVHRAMKLRAPNNVSLAQGSGLRALGDGPQPSGILLAALSLPFFSALSLLSVFCWWRIRLLGDLRLHLSAFYGWFAAAFGGYLLALWLVRRWERVTQSSASSLAPLAVIVVTAACSRLLLLGVTPSL